ncbi:MAG TPA: hypothetical protein VGD52_17400 [Pseudoduganella sp.]
MANRLRPWLALLVSALAHLGLALFLVGQASRAASEGGSAARPGPVMTVQLLGAARPAASPDSERPPADATPVAEAPASPASASEAQPPSERHYFGPEAMTRQPEVAEGLVAGKLLVVPGITPQTVALQVWISDEGRVERVALDSPMSEEEEQLLLAAFASVRFQPGRIGRVAVRGHLAMEVMLDDTLRM